MSDPDGDRLIALHPGRDLVLGPAWGVEEPAALFDSNSGDYWIVSPAARTLLDDLRRASGGRSKRALMERQSLAASDEDVEAIIDELVKLDILRSTPA